MVFRRIFLTAYFSIKLSDEVIAIEIVDSMIGTGLWTRKKFTFVRKQKRFVHAFFPKGNFFGKFSNCANFLQASTAVSDARRSPARPRKRTRRVKTRKRDFSLIFSIRGNASLHRHLRRSWWASSPSTATTTRRGSSSRGCSAGHRRGLLSAKLANK